MQNYNIIAYNANNTKHVNNTVKHYHKGGINRSANGSHVLGPSMLRGLARPDKKPAVAEIADHTAHNSLINDHLITILSHVHSNINPTVT